MTPAVQTPTSRSRQRPAPARTRGSRFPRERTLRHPASESTVFWYALGDSLTAPRPGGADGWADLVEESARAAGVEAELTNRAQVGVTATEVLIEQLPGAIAVEPQLVTLICGGNDVILSPRPDLDEFADSYAQILRSLDRFLPDATVITATYPLIDESLPLRERTRRRIREGLVELNSRIREIAPRFGAELIELAEHPGRFQASNFEPDGVHPSDVGHVLAAEAMLPAIATALGLEAGVASIPELIEDAATELPSFDDPDPCPVVLDEHGLVRVLI